MKKFEFTVRKSRAQLNVQQGAVKRVRRASAQLRRAVELMEKIEAVKPLYEELDAETLRLLDMGFTSEAVMFKGEVVEIALVDNFSEKNVAWKSCGIRRWELKAKKGGLK